MLCECENCGEEFTRSLEEFEPGDECLCDDCRELEG